MYDNLFPERPVFPYMMCMHNAPVNNDDAKYEGLEDYYHFHIELYPPLRAANKQQFMASSETGVWAHCNPTAPEEKAEEIACRARTVFIAQGVTAQWLTGYTCGQSTTDNHFY